MKKQIISMILVLCMVLSMMPVSVFAETVDAIAQTGTTEPATENSESDTSTEEAELLWEYTEVEGGVELTGYKGTSADIYVPSFIEVEGEKINVLKIADGLFKDNDALNSVTLGKGILEIGDEAFYDCDNMVCILISEELTTIGDRAFYSCDNFNSVILYDTVAYIGTDAFAECPKLKVWCNDDTAGYAYATENNIPVEILNPDAEPELHEIDGVTYYIMNGEAYVVSCDDSCTIANIRSTVSNAPVTRIREAFKNCVNLEKVVIPESVRVIDSNAFSGASNLVEITLSDSITEIGESVFRNCSSLLSITIPSNISVLRCYMFSGCSSLESVRFSGKIETIENGVFTNCASLVDINIPSTVTTIGEYVFENCEKLESIIIPDGITAIPDSSFKGCKSLINVGIPDTVTLISDSAFYGCQSLKEVDIPEKATQIGYNTFNACDSLRSVIIPEKVSMMYNTSFDDTTIILVYENSYAHNFAVKNNLWYEIYNPEALPEFYEIDGITYVVTNGVAVALEADKSLTSAIVPSHIEGYPVKEIRSTFRNCTALESVVLPERLEIITDSAFENCTSLIEVNIPNGITKIPNSCFASCTSLENVILPESITVIGGGAFEDSGIKDITIPASVDSIYSSAFYNCDNLVEIKLPENLTSLGSFAFFDCNNLKSIRIPGSVYEMEQRMFYGCDNLEKIVVEEGVAIIGMQCFMYCENLSEVILPDSLRKLWVDSFEYCHNLKSVVIPENVQEFSTVAVDIDYPPHRRINTLFLVYENSLAFDYFDGFDMLYALYDGEKAQGLYEIDGVSYCVMDGEAVAYFADKDITTATIQATVDGYPVKRLYSTFTKRDKLTSVEIPYGVEKIDIKAFMYCTSLEKVNIPESVEVIGYDAFGYCDSLREINFPDSLITIKSSAFSGCKNLLSIHIPESVTTFEHAFYGCENLRSVRISANIRSLPTWAFENCVNLRSVIIDKNVKIISLGAFRYCKNLTHVELYDCVESVSSIAFSGCKNLRTILIPESVNFFASNSVDGSTILLVHENSYAHNFAKNNDLLYFVLHKTENPLINYGTGLSGVVTYTDGSVASKATVEILYADGTVKETVVTDENGAYASTYAEVGDYIIRATDSEGNTANTQASVKRMNVFEVFVSGDTNPVLKKSYSVSGTVNEGGATVTITDEKGNIIDSVVADENGNFTFEDIPNGTYVVTAKGEKGSVSQEVTIFDGNLSDLYLEIIPESVTIWGLVEVEDRKGNQTPRNWVDVTIYNSDGVVVDKCKTDSDGKYIFENLTLGEYSIVAEVYEMREDHHYGYDRNHKLTGYAYMNITQTGEYQAETIVLKEEKESLSTFEGKVTANGETQDCQVILRDSNRNEIAKVTTQKNGKFSFSNICDGVYYILAITKSNGMGYTVITVKDSVVYGDLHIRVYKSDKVQRREAEFEHDVPTCHTREDALKYKDRIAEEKRFYDGLSEKEKKQLSEFYVERLNKLSEWITNVSYETPENVVVEQGGLVVSGSEIENESEIAFNLNIEPIDSWQANENGIETEEDYIYHDVKAAANTQELKQYYEITMTKTINGEEKSITSVRKDTDAMGKFRITMPIPEEYKGYKHYSMVHVHNGETVVLADLDDNPDTITVEISEFSTFVLTATDTVYSSAIYSLGDIDLDGEITIMDATRVQMYLAEKTKLTEESLAVADTGKDGVISVMDATLIQMFVAQLVAAL